MRTVLAVLLVTGLAACASPRTGAEPVVRYDDVDRDRMSVVEKQALSTGVRVHWVNPPRKPQR